MKRHLIPLILVGLTTMFFYQLAYAQSSKEAVRALKKLEAKTEVGVSRRDYSSALGDAKFEVNLYLGNTKGSQQNKLTKAISRAMELYEDAWIVMRNSQRDSEPIIPGGPFAALIDKYPELGRLDNEGGAISSSAKLVEESRLKSLEKMPIDKRPTSPVKSPPKLDVDIACSILWKKASKELDVALGLLGKP